MEEFIFVFISFGMPIVLILWARKSYLKKEEKRELEESMRNGAWEFPAEELYRRCSRMGYHPSKNSYEMYLICKDIACEYGVPEDCYDIYCSEEKAKEYYDFAYNTPQCGNIPDNVFFGFGAQPQSVYKELASKIGNEKNVVLLESYIASALKTVNDAQSIDNALLQMTKPTKSLNPGVAGGIANAIAGPGAGLYAAAKAEEQNQKDAAQRKAWLEYYYSNHAQNSAAADHFSKVADRFLMRIRLLEKRKIYTEIPTEEIFKKLSFESSLTNNKPCFRNLLYLGTTVSFKENLPLPEEGYKLDGSFTAKLYVKDRLIDTLIVPFDKDGERTLGAYSDKYLRGENREKDIRVEYSPNHLWFFKEQK